MSRAFDEVREIGRQEGIQKTQQEERQETARSLLAMGKLSLEDISIASRISIDEVKKLQAQLNHA